MPIVIRTWGEVAYPVVVCNHCGKRIESASDGNYQWPLGVPVAEASFTHKRCSLAFEHARPSGHPWAAMELDVLPAFLAANLRIDPDEAERRAERCGAY
jgi:hypothetical protein